MPDDPTPHGGEALHGLPDRAKIPQPKPDAAQPGLDPQAPVPTTGHVDRPSSGDIARRPALPEHPQTLAADTLPRPDPIGSQDPEDADDNGRPPATQQPAR